MRMQQLFVATVLAQQFRYLLVASKSRIMQRSVTVVILNVDWGITRQQQLCNLLFAPQGRPMQRRFAIIVFI